MIQIAWAALILWPIVAIVLYQKLPLPEAFCATILGGYLLLPTSVGLDLPLLPALNKHTIPVFSALVLSMMAFRKEEQIATVLPSWLPRSKVALTLLGVIVLSALGTTAGNSDTLVYGTRIIGGLSVFDAFSSLLEFGVLLLPMLIARRIFATLEAQKVLLVSLTMSAAIYCLPTLWEVRMSPTLSSNIYGFFPHSFVQHIRQGGYRPIVFFGHGLELSMYLTLAIIAAAGLFRSATQQSPKKWFYLGVLLIVTMVLSKSIGPLILAVLFVPLVLFLKPKRQLLIATCVAVVVLLYPVLRAQQIVPTDDILATVSEYSTERAGSLKVRFDNEDILLAKGRERPVFGWGAWGRSRVFDEYGNDLSITDGAWVGEFGVGGWVRYIGIFGLLCWPIFGLYFTKRDQIDRVSCTIALIIAAKLLDLLPNSGMPPILWILVGSLLGRLDLKSSDVDVSSAKSSMAEVYDVRFNATGVAETDQRAAVQYTRFVRKSPKERLSTQKPSRTQNARGKLSERYRR